MTSIRRLRLALALAATTVAGPAAWAAECGNSAAGFDTWKQAFAQEAQGRVGQAGLAALENTSYSAATVSADRGAHGFNYSLEQFMQKRGASTIIAQGRRYKQQNAGLFASIEQRYGVPAGPLIAIFGMESGFGHVRGNQNVLSSIASLAYDCRRSSYFTDQLYATLQLIDRGQLSAGSRGSMHGEIGGTQFMPKNVLEYGTGGSLDTPAVALTSTANFLRAHGWQPGAGYQPGEPNFAALQAWNAASVYERALAIMGAKIDAD
jgi:membrane-bound lytic murein transglycosylase B